VQVHSVLLTNSRSPVPDQKDYLKVGCAHSVKKKLLQGKEKVDQSISKVVQMPWTDITLNQAPRMNVSF
jgi:hypothetical protein